MIVPTVIITHDQQSVALHYSNIYCQPAMRRARIHVPGSINTVSWGMAYDMSSALIRILDPLTVSNARAQDQTIWWEKHKEG